MVEHKSAECTQCDKFFMTSVGDEETKCGLCRKPQPAQPEEPSLGELVSAVKVREEETPSGWKQPYVSVYIGSYEFKRAYHTREGAERCAEKIKNGLNHPPLTSE